MRTIITLLLVISFVGLNAQDFAQITGQFKGDLEGREIHLCKVEHGATTKVAVTKLGKDARFGFTYAVEEPGLYVINVVWDVALKKVKKDHDIKRFYLDNGTELEIELSDGKYKLLKSNCPKNTLLSKWNNQVDTVFTYSHGFAYTILDYESFFPLLPGYVEDMETFKEGINTGEANFDELMKLLVETDMQNAALQFLYTPRTKHPERKLQPEYYDYISEFGAPTSERLLELPHGNDYIRKYTMYKVMSMPEKPTGDKWQEVAIGTIPNDLLKGYYAINNLRFKSYDDRYKAFKALVGPYLLNDYLKTTLNEFEMGIRQIGEGQEAIDFGGTDINGKEHKLSDFKGNLVYVDVWATWCGPCVAQIPHLKKLEEKYHGKPITFLSISVDREKDRQKWIDYVKKEDLKGIQIMAKGDFNSDVSKAYKIRGIPRFMIFDKEGNIVTTDAPRPSQTEEIEKLLNKYL